MKTTTYGWTRKLAAMLLSCCLSVALATPSAALARNRISDESSGGSGALVPAGSAGPRFTRPVANPADDGTGSTSRAPAATRTQPRAAAPLARWLAWLLGW